MNDFKKRTTLPAPGFDLSKGAAVVKIPPPPKAVRLPLVHEEPMGTVTKETGMLKRKLTGRAPELNRTGIDYRDFVEGIKDARKLANAELKGCGETAFVLETKFGTYLLSSNALDRLKDNYSTFIDMNSDGNRKMVIPIGDKKKLHIEKIRMGKSGEKMDDLVLPIEMDYSKLPDYDLNRMLLKGVDENEVRIIINMVKVEQEKKGDPLKGHRMKQVESMSMEEDPIFDLVYISAITKKGEEYWVMIRHDEQTGRTFVIPEMAGTKEVSTGKRTYAVVTFFSEEPIDTSEITIN